MLYGRVLRALAILAFVSPSAWAQPKLFTPAGPSRPDVVEDATVIRSRPVLANGHLLSNLRREDRVQFNLFNDTSFVGVVVRSGAQTWSGLIDGAPSGSFTFVLRDQIVAGIIRAPGTHQ